MALKYCNVNIYINALSFSTEFSTTLHIFGIDPNIFLPCYQMISNDFNSLGVRYIFRFYLTDL